jgi:hypothetical protein
VAWNSSYIFSVDGFTVHWSRPRLITVVRPHFHLPSGSLDGCAWFFLASCMVFHHHSDLPSGWRTTIRKIS